MAGFSIGSIRIGDDETPAVVAEIGANHDGSPAKASKMLHAIAATGAKLVKFQLYTAEELVANADQEVTWGPPGHQKEEKIGEMFRRLSLSWEAMSDLFAEARALGLEPFATPFSEAGADKLVEIGAHAIKIAASDVNHLPFLKHVARLGVPIILSLGKCTLAEADEAVESLIANGCNELALLHCVSAYPSPMHEMNIRAIPGLKHLYPEAVIGFSDHSIGTTAAVAAVALGAHMIEKHVTYDKNAEGPDHWFSLDMSDLHSLVTAVADAYSALGHPRKRVLECERAPRPLSTRSIIAAHDLPAGHILELSDLKIVRPGTGLPPRHLDDVIGLRLARPLRCNQPLTWDCFKST